MNKIFIALTSLVLLAACTSEKEFTFVQLADIQVGFRDTTANYELSAAMMDKAIDSVNMIKPALVVLTGDMMNVPENYYQRTVYQEHIARLDTTATKLFVIPGNHEMRPYNAQTRSYYLENIGEERFSYTCQNCAFIGFDSNCIKEGADSLASDQFEWLTSELEKAQDCRYRFLFVHCPIYRESIDEGEDYFNFPKDLRVKYLDLFHKYNVNAVFSGHTHCGFYAKDGDIELITSGPVGAPLNDGRRGFTVVTVGNEGYNWNYAEI